MTIFFDLFLFFNLILFVFLITKYLELSKAISFHTRWLRNIDALLLDKDRCEEEPHRWLSAYEDRTDPGIKNRIQKQISILSKWS